LVEFPNGGGGNDKGRYRVRYSGNDTSPLENWSVLEYKGTKLEQLTPKDTTFT